jgi:hypothetical protein
MRPAGQGFGTPGLEVLRKSTKAHSLSGPRFEIGSSRIQSMRGNYSKAEDGWLLGCCAFTTLTMEAVSSSAASVTMYQTTRRNIPGKAIFILVAVRT